METEVENDVTPDTLKEMVMSLKASYRTNKRLLHRLEAMLHMSKLPSTVRNFATVVREFFDDVMKSVLDMMGMVAELLKEYSHLIQIHYGMQMDEELSLVKDTFLLLDPQKYLPFINMIARESFKIAMATTSGRRTISTDYGSALIRNNLYLAKITMRVYVREARQAKKKLHKVIESLESNWQVCSGLYWAIFKEIFSEMECVHQELEAEMGSSILGCLRVVWLWGKKKGGELWMPPETAMKLIREYLHGVVHFLKILVAEVQGAHGNLTESVSCLVRSFNVDRSSTPAEKK